MPTSDTWVWVTDTAVSRGYGNATATINQVVLTDKQWKEAQKRYGVGQLFAYSWGNWWPPEEEVSEGDKEWGVVSVHKNRRQKCERE